MKQVVEQAIDSKIALKLQMQETSDIEVRILREKQRAFDLTEKTALLTAQKHLLLQRIDACAGRTNWSISLLEENLAQLQEVDLVLSDILSRLDVNQLNNGDIELVRLLGELV